MQRGGGGGVWHMHKGGGGYGIYIGGGGRRGIINYIFDMTTI